MDAPFGPFLKRVWEVCLEARADHLYIALFQGMHMYVDCFRNAKMLTAETAGNR
jgi:hypothetical protein